MQSYSRYAVYWAPPADHPLATLGAQWLGWDPQACCTLPQPQAPAGARPMAEVTADPARYGLHGTLKPPFRLDDGVGRAALEDACTRLAATIPAFDGPEFAVASKLGFLSLMPSAPCPALDALAAASVQQLDPLRAPLNEAELARRRARPLSERQEKYLAAWGYPYVLEEFRFHVTLSGRLRDDTEAGALSEAATAHFKGATGFPVTELTLFGDPGGGAPFHILTRFPLATGR